MTIALQHWGVAMRAVAVIGPSQSGKSTLVKGVSSLEGARAQPLVLHGGASVTPFEFMGDRWAMLEAPGGHDAFANVGPILATCDSAVLCVPAQADAAVLAAPYLRMLEEAKLPTFLFVNKVDAAAERIADIVASLQQYCRSGIVLRQVPIRDGGEITGVIDLISERAWKYHEDSRSSLVELPAEMMDREQAARSELLEAFADYDDALLEQIIEDKLPGTEDVYSVATQVLQHHDLVPALLGAASHGNGLLRLMKSLRHEVPDVGSLRERIDRSSDVLATACLGDQLKHLGKIVLVRALEGGMGPGVRLGGDTLGNLNSLDAKTPVSSPLEAGEFALAIKSDHVLPGTYLSSNAAEEIPVWALKKPPAIKRLVHPAHEKDDGKLSSALSRLAEIDPGLTVMQDEVSGSAVVGVQGQQHLRTMVAKLLEAFGIEVICEEIPTALRETIRGSASIHHRHRKQSGGAGQFADVVIDVAPRKSGSGFAFDETVKGGAVPRNYIPSVEAGARDAMAEGPAGHPVVDVSVTLKDGKSHSVDSSDFAFRTAGHNAVKEALNETGTRILQPILSMEIHVPSVFTGELVQALTGLKGQVLGFEPHSEAAGWDVFRALLPAASDEALSQTLGSATRGTAWFHCEIDHYEEMRNGQAGRAAS